MGSGLIASSLKTIAPLCALFLVLLGLNFGLHERVAPPTLERLTLPYWNTFERTNFDWIPLQNTWRIEGGWLRPTGSTASSAQSGRAVTPGISYRLMVMAHLEVGSTVGALFGGQVRGQLVRTHRVRLVRHERSRAVQCGYFDQEGRFQLQDEVALPSSSRDTRLEIEVGTAVYAIRVDGRRVLESQPLKFAGGFPGLEASTGSAIGEILIRPGLRYDPNEAITDAAANASLPRLSTDTLEGAGWQVLSGSWSLGPSGLMQADNRDFDRVVLYKAQPFTLGTIRVFFRQTRGAGAGMLFAAPDLATGVQGAQLVRYSDDGRIIFWGTFDPQGRFIGRGNRTVLAPGVRAHTLEVVVNSGSYAIKLDDVELVRGVSLERSSGYIGLSTSKSAAAFTRVTVTSLEAGKLNKERDIVRTGQKLTR